jgi:hypothetical protein
MTRLKKFGLMLLIAVSVIALAKAGEDRITFDRSEIFNLIISKIKTASAAISAGSKCEDVALLIKAAFDTCNEVDASDWVDKERMNGCRVLRTAKKHAKACDVIAAKNKLTRAENMFEAMKIRALKLQVIQ